MLGSSAVRSSECVRCRPTTSQKAWMRTRSAGCTGVRRAGARCDDVLEEVGEGRPEVAPEGAPA
eukprot:2749097-Alexandrium_andersonii.AAC.1